MKIYFYKEFGPLGYLSNYSAHEILVDGKVWQTVEHYYQAQKFFDEKLKEQIRLASTPKDASKIGRDRNNPLRKDWEQVKEEIMFNGVFAKFLQHKDICDMLLATGDDELIENTDIDYYWGCGTNKTGLNRYGEILMKVRKTIREGMENK